MADREQLHALVDSLPEGAWESAQTYLSAIQTWPPKPHEYPPQVEQHRKELEAKRDKFLKLGGSGTWAMDTNNKSHASFGTSEHNWETGELTIRTFRVHCDFPMELTERLLMEDDNRKLHYEFHISGLGAEHGLALDFEAPESAK